MKNIQNRNENINYGKVCESIIAGLAGRRPKLLLHVCCAPCSSSVVEYLSDHFELALYYYNPNIYPEEEYVRRLCEFSKLTEGANFYTASVIPGNYDTEEFYKAVSGLEAEKEGGDRCKACIRLRMEESARYASENGFEFFTTSLSVSPHKNARFINETGRALEEKYGLRYLYSDFKKKNGYARSIELCRQFDVYRQDYCGCSFSIRKEGRGKE